MEWINADIDTPRPFQNVEAITNKGKIVTAWIDLFESDDGDYGDYFDWEWMGREPLDFIIKWRPRDRGKD